MEVATYYDWIVNIISIIQKDRRVRMCVEDGDLSKVYPKDDFPLLHITRYSKIL